MKIPVLDNRRLSRFINDYTEYLHGRGAKPSFGDLPPRLRQEAGEYAVLLRLMIPLGPVKPTAQGVRPPGGGEALPHRASQKVPHE